MKLPRFTLGLTVGFALGLGTVAMAVNPVIARVDTNGQLVGYIVQKDGSVICRDPMVWNQFRGPDTYIVCE